MSDSFTVLRLATRRAFKRTTVKKPLSIYARVSASLIFVPCKDGISHNEAESAEPEHLAAGAQVLLETLLARAGAARRA